MGSKRKWKLAAYVLLRWRRRHSRRLSGLPLRKGIRAMQMHNPAHPGRILAYYLQGRTITEVARHLGVTRPALSRVLNGKASVSAEMALRISEAFNTDPELWLRLQAQRDLWVASRKRRTKVKPLVQSAAA
ncbi:MAG: HigA family addiction module antitoxin [Terracidiphilus sp.]